MKINAQGSIQTVSISQVQEFLAEEDYASDEVILAHRYATNRDSVDFGCPTRIDGVVVGLVSRGEVTMEVNLDTVKAGANSLVLILPDKVCQIVDVQEDTCGCMLLLSRKFLFSLNVDLQRVMPILIDLSICTRLEANEFELISRAYQLLLDAVNSDNPFFETEILQNMIESLFYMICSMLYKRNPVSDVKHSRSEEHFEQFLHMLSKYRKRERSVAFYADKLNITPKYLSTVIKDVSGKSAAQWIDECVIFEAKTLLKFSNMSIQEVAYDLNFSTQSFFGKYFKQHTGLSPKEYKRQNRNVGSISR